MNLRCHLAAAVLLVSCSGCIFDLFGGKKEDPGIRPVGGDKAGIVAVDLTSDFDKVKEPKIDADTWFAAGQIQESQGKVAGAIENYRKTLTINDSHHGALYRLGVLYATTQKYDDAI